MEDERDDERRRRRRDDDDYDDDRRKRSRPARDDDDGVRLYIGNIPYSMTTETLRDHFSSCGRVVDAIVKTDSTTGRSRGFGIVAFERQADAHYCIDKWNNKDWEGRPLVVRYDRGGGSGGGGPPPGPPRDSRGGGSRREDDYYNHRGGSSRGGGEGSGFGGGYPRDYGGPQRGGSSRRPQISTYEIRRDLVEREKARMARDYKVADDIRASLASRGVTVNDFERTWRSEDGRGGPRPSAHDDPGDEPDRRGG
eukprot:CAMPEP_0118900474 /NCGR_PEP_ID=MMETSP1166-20130328/6576_1 /TAXON_ID=1104430 /ORGANISM="Chrysoreinhardia sp, Strain CCMP3193" /LENGTH=252 /DNA_ID=CAMNT_0006839617 /DNA_START=106 /DNA_END=860 /DNA_ORIENTATION=-